VERIVIVGCGGVGGIVASGLVVGGRDVLAVTHNPTISAAIREHGLRARVGGEERRVELAAKDVLEPADGPFDMAFLAVPPNAAEAACDALRPALRDGAPIVCFQNGLVEERLAAKGYGAQLLGGVVSFGASMLGPGQVEQTSAGGFVLGRLDGALDETLERVAAALRPVGEVELTRNLRGARWSKLAINCAISSLGTLGGDRLGALMRHRFVRRLCLEVMTEVTQVAQAQGVQLEKVAGTLDLEWLALDDDERRVPGSPGLVAKHTVLLAVGARYRRLRSSMLAAIERGREPPVEFLNGEVVERAQRHGIPVPINEGLLLAVQRLGREGAKPSHEAVRALFEATRPALRALDLAA
jgi:2-dehydropantoate 2-reductase